MSQDVSILKTVLVTGGSRGIGRAICVEFGRAGWQVGVQYRQNKSAADETMNSVRSHGGVAFSTQGDISLEQDVRAMVQAALGQGGSLDVLVCNAGIASSRLIVRMDPAEWESIIATNLTGTFLCLKAVAESFMAQGKGSIIVVGSFAGLQGQIGQAAYAASKAGLIGLIKTTARELGTYNIAINGILPGWHQTDMTQPTPLSPLTLDDHVLSHRPTLEEVARSVVFLSTLQGISGQVWNLDSRLY